jgi:uncharacterized RDD family membrane protein YckC
LIYNRAIVQLVPTYYELLGVAPDSSQEDIKKAYRELALTCHPDVNNSSKAQGLMRLLNEAYEVLSDPEKRAAYDLKIKLKGPEPERKKDQAAPCDNMGAADYDKTVDYRVYEDEVRKRSRPPNTDRDEGNVAEDLPDAHPYNDLRIYSACLDTIIMAMISLPLGFFIASSVSSISQAMGIKISLYNSILIIILFLVSIAYYAIFEGSRGMATPGKIYFKLIVQERKNGRISVTTSIIRSLFKVSTIYIILYLLLSEYAPISLIIMACILLLIYFENWTIHDYLANTVVVKNTGNDAW